jgi:hypothetical protein
LRNNLGIKSTKIAEAAAANPRERSVKLQGKIASIHLDKKETYHLTNDITRNPTTYVAARGYRYFGANDHGYRHGGLTPEETIVPFLVAEMAMFTIEPLQITYYGNDEGLEKGKTHKNFSIQIRNKNKFTVQIVSIAIQEDPNCHFTVPAIISSESDLILSSNIKIAQKYEAHNGQTLLTALLDYHVNAENFTETVTFFVPIRSSEIDNFNFDDL